MKKDDFMKKVIISMLVFLLIFTVIVLLLFYITGGVEPTALITAVFAFVGAEAGFCSLIKSLKVKNEASAEGNEGDARMIGFCTDEEEEN